MLEAKDFWMVRNETKNKRLDPLGYVVFLDPVYPVRPDRL